MITIIVGVVAFLAGWMVGLLDAKFTLEKFMKEENENALH